MALSMTPMIIGAAISLVTQAKGGVSHFRQEGARSVQHATAR
jgi:hypothetical protein